MNSLINEFLKDLAQKTNIPFSLNENGQCFLNYDNGIHCTIEVPENSDCVFFYVPLIPVPFNYNKKLLYDVLSMNLHQVLTHGTTIAIDSVNKQFTLCFSKPINSFDSTSFQNILGNFFETASLLKSQLIQLID